MPYILQVAELRFEPSQWAPEFLNSHTESWGGTSTAAGSRGLSKDAHTVFWYTHLLSSYQNQQPVSYFPYCCECASQILFCLLGHWLHRDCNTMERTDNKIYSTLILHLIYNEKCTIASVKYLWVGLWSQNVFLCDTQNME